MCSRPIFSSLRVPLGFVCGYPLSGRTGGELYGGSMFARSAASDTLQGRAMQAVNARWGEDVLKRSGRESIGIPVCKKKYAPFVFGAVQEPATGRWQVQVERMYACKCHNAIRKAVIAQHGLRPGWEPFGQWSMAKAFWKMAKQPSKMILLLLWKRVHVNGRAMTRCVMHRRQQQQQHRWQRRLPFA
jgi:hypothetical protein